MTTLAAELQRDEARAAPAWLHSLRSTAAVRERSLAVYRFVAEGRSPHFTLGEAKLPEVAAYVAQVCRDDYPDLAIPVHSRWRHFEVGGVDRWNEIAAGADAQAAIDLAAVSVLLDAGAGSDWRYRDMRTGQVFARSEGLAVASFEMFRAGGFSSDPARPLQADAQALARIDAATLARFFQVNDGNPLVGLEQRALLLRRLGAALAARPQLFGPAGRPGALLNAPIVRNGAVSLPEVLTFLLDAFGGIWPSALVVGGHAVGDAALHPAIVTGDETSGVVPFHKLSQWLTYSLVEPLQWAGLTVTDIDGLTGLPEYRNGGLFVDFGVLDLRDDADRAKTHRVDSQLVCEWRALTVTLLDRLLPLVRRELRPGDDFMLPHMLQGGTWSAGRRMAARLRPPDGVSPIAIDADGTVF